MLSLLFSNIFCNDLKDLHQGGMLRSAVCTITKVESLAAPYIFPTALEAVQVLCLWYSICVISPMLTSQAQSV